jgi:Periplasmic binding protein
MFGSINRPQLDGVVQISLGFKQLAQRLHGHVLAWRPPGTLACIMRLVACSSRRHQNKLIQGFDVAWVSAAQSPGGGIVMMKPLKWAGLAVLLCVAGPAAAQEKVKIGVIVTLSGPAAALGQQVRDGFALAVRDLGGKMSSKDVEVVVVDDELKPVP